MLLRAAFTGGGLVAEQVHARFGSYMVLGIVLVVNECRISRG